MVRSWSKKARDNRHGKIYLVGCREKEINKNDVPECVKVIKESFGTVADEFDFFPKLCTR